MSELPVSSSHPQVVYMLLVLGVKWNILGEVHILSLYHFSNVHVCPLNCFFHPVEFG